MRRLQRIQQADGSRVNTRFDIAVIGSGFAGSIAAMIARRLGHTVVLIDRGRHPRFAIGESSTPLANLLLEQLARDYDLPALGSLSKWGAWRKAHPEIACGLKRGFTFFHHHFDEPWAAATTRHNELLVAASPHDGIADTHWFRPEFDQFLALQAQQLGVELLEETILTAAEFSKDIGILSGSRGGQPLKLSARFVIDASGPRVFLHHALGQQETSFATLPATEGLYSHFTGVHRWDARHGTAETPPYPVDDAAVHHVFDGGWIWVLRFNNGITSAGVAATPELASKLGFADGEPAWRRLLERLPSVRELFQGAQVVRPFVHAPRLAFRGSVAAGSNWALLPSAAGFVDPLLSTGFPLTLLGVARVSELLQKHWGSPQLGVALADYSAQTFRELDATASLVGALYARMDEFDVFTALTLLYFAAASYAEAARRLGKNDRANSFLLLDRDDFAATLRRCIAAARGPLSASTQASFSELVAAGIAPVNVAGLANAGRRNWYPALAEDLLAAAPKLGVDRAAISDLLRRSGF